MTSIKKTKKLCFSPRNWNVKGGYTIQNDDHHVPYQWSISQEHVHIVLMNLQRMIQHICTGEDANKKEPLDCSGPSSIDYSLPHHPSQQINNNNSHNSNMRTTITAPANARVHKQPQ